MIIRSAVARASRQKRSETNQIPNWGFIRFSHPHSIEQQAVNSLSTITNLLLVPIWH